MSLKLYNADSKWCDFLRTFDRCVPYTMDKKSTRPFVGIVLSVNGFNYFAPLTSPKEKHLTMKNQIDFFKINGGKWGAINFNNMIPINIKSIKEVDLKILPTDSEENRNYKTLLANQTSWCNLNRDKILSQASKLYNIVVNGQAWEGLAKRCCNFKVLENELVKLEHLGQINTTNQKCDEILKANPELKAKLNAAAAEYFSKHNLPPFDSSSPADERYEMRNIILNENPKLKEEYVKAKKEYEQGQLAESSKNSPTHKDDLTPQHRR